jgi:hypothetical protein
MELVLNVNTVINSIQKETVLKLLEKKMIIVLNINMEIEKDGTWIGDKVVIRYV